MLQVCHKCVTRASQDHTTTRASQGCYKRVPKVLQGCYVTLTGARVSSGPACDNTILHSSSVGVMESRHNRVSKESTWEVLHGCYNKGVTRVLQQGCYKGVTRMLQGRYKGVTKV
jgi:hypothetical protein